MATPVDSRRWKQLLERPDLAVAAARRGDPLAASVLAHIPLRARLAAEKVADRHAVDRAVASDLVATVRGVGFPNTHVRLDEATPPSPLTLAELRARYKTRGSLGHVDGKPCCQACAEGRACEGAGTARFRDSPGAVGACCQACAEGRACEGDKPGHVGSIDFDIDKAERNQRLRRPDLFEAVGASDDSCNGCPPGMVAVETPAAIPNRYICVFPDQTPPSPTWSQRLRNATDDGSGQPVEPPPPPPRPSPQVPDAPDPARGEADAAPADAPRMVGGIDVASLAPLVLSSVNVPYAAFTPESVPSTVASIILPTPTSADPSGQQAIEAGVDLFSKLVSGGSVDVRAEAKTAGAIIGGAALTPEFGPIGTVIGSALGQVIGGAIGSLVSPGGDCDAVCLALKSKDGIAAQMCKDWDGSIDGTCLDGVYNALLHFYTWSGCWGCKDGPGDGSFWKGEYEDSASVLAQQYGLPPNSDPTPLLKAMISYEAAKVRIANDTVWAQNVIIAANNYASTYAPFCPSCDPGCVELVQGNAISLALAEHPFRQGNTEIAATVAHAQLSDIQGIIDTARGNKGCTPNGDGNWTCPPGCLAYNDPGYAAAAAQCASQVGYVFQYGKCQTTEQYAAGKALGDAMQQALQNDCATKSGSHWDMTKPGIGGRAGACVTTEGAWCTTSDGQTQGVYDANGNCVQANAYPGDSCLAADGPGSYDGHMTCVADHSDKTEVIRECAGHADLTWDPATLECRPLRAGEDKYEVVVAKLKNKALAELAQQAEATAAVEQQKKTRLWLYALGAMALGAAGWSGYRVYTKQPIVPPKAVAAVKALPEKVKGVFKGKKK
jgi:hypothetical protein